LNGQPPFHGSKLTQKLIDHQIKVPPPRSALRPEVPLALCAVVCKMMAKKAEDRYQSPAEVREALKRWLTYEATPTAFTATAESGEIATPLVNATKMQTRRGLLPWIVAACLTLG